MDKRTQLGITVASVLLIIAPAQAEPMPPDRLQRVIDEANDAVADARAAIDRLGNGTPIEPLIEEIVERVMDAGVLEGSACITGNFYGNLGQYRDIARNLDIRGGGRVSALVPIYPEAGSADGGVDGRSLGLIGGGGCSGDDDEPLWTAEVSPREAWVEFDGTTGTFDIRGDWPGWLRP